jgi:Mn2+/Fe2+ NRAMP family transporter
LLRARFQKTANSIPADRSDPVSTQAWSGLITGASDDDPSGIGTYSQAGAQLGYSIGWTMLLTYLLMVAIQEISARIGRTTPRHLREFVSPLSKLVIQLIVTL